MNKPFNQLTDAEAERLALLLEELGEIQQAIGKILRHGYESTHPAFPDGLTNRQHLQKELGDAAARAQLMVCAGDIDAEYVNECAREKTAKHAFLHHQDDQNDR